MELIDWIGLTGLTGLSGLTIDWIDLIDLIDLVKSQTHNDMQHFTSSVFPVQQNKEKAEDTARSFWAAITIPYYIYIHIYGEFPCQLGATHPYSIVVLVLPHDIHSILPLETLKFAC
jgi:hypothetical protein